MTTKQAGPGGHNAKENFNVRESPIKEEEEAVSECVAPKAVLPLFFPQPPASLPPPTLTHTAIRTTTTTLLTSEWSSLSLFSLALVLNMQP